MAYFVGIDIGGTFTDAVLLDDSGTARLLKTPTTPQDPAVGVNNALALAEEELGLEKAQALGEVEYFGLGTTVATNALTERKGVTTGAGMNQTGWALGVGRRLLDELRELSKKRANTPGALVTSDDNYGEFARHEARFRAARAFLREVWTDNERTLADGRELNQEQQTLSHLAASHLSRTTLEISQLMHRFAIESHPDWVIETCRRPAEEIMDEGRSKHYDEAVNWLAKARGAHLATKREEQWRAYLEELIARHGRKYKLRPMLEDLLK